MNVKKSIYYLSENELEAFALQEGLKVRKEKVFEYKNQELTEEDLLFMSGFSHLDKHS